jgi:hypothetical protein
MSDAPKSAVELAMERLRMKDAAAGIEQKPLTDAQRAAIAEARSIHDAAVAERRIMHETSMRRTFDPAEQQELDRQFRRDLDRFATDRDTRIRKIRENG